MLKAEEQMELAILKKPGESIRALTRLLLDHRRQFRLEGPWEPDNITVYKMIIAGDHRQN